MQEIQVKGKNIGLKVYVNDIPNLKLIPKEKSDNIIKELELEINVSATKN